MKLLFTVDIYIFTGYNIIFVNMSSILLHSSTQVIISRTFFSLEMNMEMKSIYLDKNN